MGGPNLKDTPGTKLEPLTHPTPHPPNRLGGSSSGAKVPRALSTVLVISGWQQPPGSERGARVRGWVGGWVVHWVAGC